MIRPGDSIVGTGRGSRLCLETEAQLTRPVWQVLWSCFIHTGAASIDWTPSSTLVKSRVDESLAGGEFERGLQMLTTATSNLREEWPRLVIREELFPWHS